MSSNQEERTAAKQKVQDMLDLYVLWSYREN